MISFCVISKKKKKKNYIRKNRLLESSEISKQNWHKTTKNGILKLRLLKNAMEISIIHSQHSLPFSRVKKL